VFPNPDSPGKPYTAIYIVVAIAFVLLLGTSQLVHAAPEYIQSEQTAAGSVDESTESSEHAFKLPRPAKVFAELGDVLRESTLNLHLRNYYFDRERDANSNIQAWAQGGGLELATPSWRDRLQLGTTLYTSQKLYGPADKDGSKLLEPGQQSFTVLGQAYLEARLYKNLSLKAYRQRIELPYLNGDDSRMVPNTFETVSLFDFSGKRFVYGLGQTWKIKKRDATNFISMTEAAGIKGPDRAVSTVAARYTFANEANVGMINHYGRDFINIFYTEGNTRTRTRMGVGFQLSAQYANQRSVGDQLGGDFDTRFWGAKLAASRGGLLFSLARTSTTNNAGIKNNWGGDPSYISIMIKDFDRAGEDAWLLGLSSDFSYFGDTGFSGFINYAWGDTPDNGSDASPDQSEFDITLDYKPKTGVTKGLWFRLRAAFVDQDGSDGNDLRDIRLIANYDFSVL
jgi:hypothetical protein